MTYAPNLGRGEVIDADHRDVAHAKEFGSSRPAVTSYYLVFDIDQDRAHKSKLFDVGGDLPDLSCGVSP